LHDLGLENEKTKFIHYYYMHIIS